MAKVAKAKAMKASLEWIFENNPPMGGAAGEAFTNTLASSGMPPEAVLAREAIQNSVDARASGEQKVAVDFIMKALTGAEKAQFVETARLKSIDDRASELDLKQPNCLTSLDLAGAPLNLLFVNDYNTTGLAGDPSNADSKFFRFLLSLGDGGKEHDEHGTGGSYGFGKSVYSSNSGILTIFAYSRTQDEKGHPLSLLFGCGYYRKHKHEDEYFTGRAWFGYDTSPGYVHAQQIVIPLRGEAADETARRLGFDVRTPDQIGTSVLIVDAMVDLSGILHGVEDWWWPRLLAHQLDVRVVDTSGKVSLPRPRKRADLQPFLDAYELATGKSPQDSKTGFRRPFLKLDNVAIGQAGFKVLEKNENDEFVVGEARIDSVALIRSPLMVVAYHRAWNVAAPAMAGAFLADPEIDDILRAAEPPAHDRWDVDARRLQDQTGYKRTVVKRILDNIRRNLKSCQGTASPPPPPRPKRLTMLERTLASFLAPAKKGTKSPEPSAAPIHLTYDQEPKAEAVDGKLRLTTRFSVRLKADEDVQTLRARVRISCPVVEDGQAGDSIGLTMSSSIALTDDKTREGWRAFELGATAVKFECVSEPYDPLWTVRFVPEVEAVEGV
ncbi:hypothetical protein SAMN04515648_2882 [Phyllobacterium sp. CL33Tsu]|uniref:hypothetical protein n=1 Tax=Phyllobacterium sp. CL33Tsu TaxID=1798191 RepID=UPI0008E4E508|nr:hypothetical protein [Phyllobacterium sp. CL33Tsu]SFJ14878.1 hypothetical protein SAMN04515648_2882 [Phyllobacterium sp. CL33Tsu]